MPRSPQLTRDLLLAALGMTTGACDAAAFGHLGHVFASVVTGNLVLLGISAVREGGSSALFAGCGVLGYALGVLATAPRSASEAGPANVMWPPAVNRILIVDLVLLAGFALGWELIGDRPAEAPDAALLLVVAAAMGVQSSASRRIGRMSTTYLTGTLTGILESLRRRAVSEATERDVRIIVMAIIGAALGTVLIRWGQRWLPLLPPLPIVIVLVLARRRFARRGEPA